MRNKKKMKSKGNSDKNEEIQTTVSGSLLVQFPVKVYDILWVTITVLFSKESYFLQTLITLPKNIVADCRGLYLEQKSLTVDIPQWTNEFYLLHASFNTQQIETYIWNEEIMLKGYLKTVLNAHEYHYINMKPNDKW